MTTSRNEKSFMQKLLIVMQSMGTSPAELQWQAHRDHAEHINTLLDRVAVLEMEMTALRSRPVPQEAELCK